MEHTIVYKEEGRYAGWPANYGIWSWGDEIVVGFTSGYHKLDAHFHARDTTRPFRTMQARSRDGGKTWGFKELPARIPGGLALSADEHVQSQYKLAGALEREDLSAKPIRSLSFMHPDFAMMCARTSLSAGARSMFYTSINRCQSWEGPYLIPDFGLNGVAARTDYQLLGPDDCLLFLTAAKENGEEGRVFCARTIDGGATFQFVSWIGEHPDRGFHIMPASVRLPSTRLLCALRCRDDLHNTESSNWIDLYASDDSGLTWRMFNRPVPVTGKGGNPPTLTRLKDGRLVLVYGYRNAPYGIRAKISTDEGATWGEEIILREDAGSFDIGYPRTTLSADGTLVTVYYYNDEKGGACYIAATRWKP